VTAVLKPLLITILTPPFSRYWHNGRAGEAYVSCNRVTLFRFPQKIKYLSLLSRIFFSSAFKAKLVRRRNVMTSDSDAA
jgi:hypothetical protein